MRRLTAEDYVECLPTNTIHKLCLYLKTRYTFDFSEFKNTDKSSKEKLIIMIKYLAFILNKKRT